MRPECWERVQEVYPDLMDAREPDREELLVTRCGGDDELETELRRLLRIDEARARALGSLVGQSPRLFPEPRLFSEMEGLSRDRLGDFRLLEELGRGGVGVVYVAEQISVGRKVAVKVLHPRYAQSEQAVERFRREVRAMARLSHPGIVKLHTFGEEQGELYYAMEMVDGVSLAEVLRAFRSGEVVGLDLRDPIRVVEVVEAIAEAVHYCHVEGVVHRDLKPQNILIDRAGRPHVLDFGIVLDPDLSTLTSVEDLAGTPHYMSPEQTRNGRVDGRSDIFSLGVLLYELLTLARPFAGDTPDQILGAIRSQDPVALRRHNPRLPGDLETICHQALEKTPEKRYPTAQELADDLGRFRRHEAIVARPASIGRRLLRKAGRNAGWLGLAAAVLILPILGALLAAAFSERTRKAGLFRVRDAVQAGVTRLEDPELEELQRDIDALIRTGSLTTEEWVEVGRYKQLAESWTSNRGAWSGVRSAQDVLTASGEIPLTELFRMRDQSVEVETLVQLAELSMARITVVSSIRGSDVSLQLIDGKTGRPGVLTPVGLTPLEEFVVVEGYYRVVVHAPGVGYSEQTRYFRAREKTYEIAAAIRPTASVTPGMIEIPGGPFLFGGPSPYDGTEEAWEETLPAFWIDETEVSNKNYREFCRSTGRAGPFWWGENGEDYDPAWDDLPVAGVTWLDARAFAEWAGKRLPTQFEWERAARGTDGRALPWGNDPAEIAERAVLGRKKPGRSELELYLRAVAPVRSYPGGRSPDGLSHVLGNVAEWTESLNIDRYEGEPYSDPAWALTKGLSWSSSDPPELIHLSMRGVGRVTYPPLSLGFRCAKSGIID